MCPLTQKEAKQQVHYEPSTGAFTWNLSKRGGGACKGEPAGTLHPYGYNIIRILGKNYRGGRLAFLYMKGYFPENEVDHINRIRHDDAWDNLEEKSKTCQMRNTKTRKDNRYSSVKGVTWDANKNKWRAQITVNGVRSSLRYHKDFYEAVCHRLAAEQCIGWSTCNADSPAHNYIKGVN